MATIGKVRAVFTANANGLQSGVNAAAGSMKKLQASAAATASSMRSLVAIQGAQLFGSIANGVSNAVSSLTRWGQAEAEAIDRTSKLAARLGFTYGELAGLGLAADLAGVSMDQIGAAATKADVAFVKAAGGSKEANDAFASLGLSVQQLNGLSAAERFEAISSAIAALPTEAERAAAAVRIFGSSGAELLPLFNAGAGAIAAARQEAEAMGLALTNAQGQDVENMNDAFTRVQKTISGIVQQVVANLAPTVTAIANTFTEFVKSYGGANIGEGIAGVILDAAGYMADVADYIVSAIPDVWRYLEDIGKQWGTVWEIGQRLFSFVAVQVRAFETVFKFVGSIITGLVGRLAVTAGQLAKLIPGLGNAGRAVENFGRETMEISTTLWNEAGEAAAAWGENAVDTIFGIAEDAGDGIARPIRATFDEARRRAEQSANAIDQAARGEIKVNGKEAAKDIANGIRTAIPQAVRGIDSRSQDGIREMFRIMRGEDSAAVQERIARASERTADALEDNAGGIDLDVVGLAPAAGG